LNPAKCLFFQQRVEFLGLAVSAAGVEPLADRVQAVRQFPRPTTVKELQGFLGAVNFYRRFIPSAAQLLLPLTVELKGGRKGAEPLAWSAQMEAAFCGVKGALERAAVLDFPSPTAEVCLATDASATAVGVVLQQRDSAVASWRPLGFFSQKLEKAQQAYSTFDRELFAVYAAIRHFRHQLEGRRFQVWTDHKPLTFMLSQAADNRSARQQRHISYVSEFTADIRHVAGNQNVVADLLSRPPVAVPAAKAAQPPSAAGSTAGASGECSTVSSSSPSASITGVAPSGVDLAAMAAAQAACPAVDELLSSSALHIQQVKLADQTLLCDVSTGRQRPLVPLDWRRAVLAAIHNISHPGIRATRRLVGSRFVWKGMATDVADYCRSCVACQRAKVTKQPAAPVQQMPVPSRRFSQIHVDLVGPLPACSQGFSYLLTVIDRSTRWLEAVPLASTSAAAVADALVASWTSRFGVPDLLVSDRGPQFTSAVWAVLCQRASSKPHTPGKEGQATRDKQMSSHDAMSIFIYSVI